MKLKIIFNSNSILTLSQSSATTKVTAVCDVRTWGRTRVWAFRNGPGRPLARPAPASVRIHPDPERLHRSYVGFPWPAVFQGKRCHPRGNGGQPELLRDRRAYSMAVLTDRKSTRLNSSHR